MWYSFILLCEIFRRAIIIKIINRIIGLVGRVFANDPGNLGSIPVQVIQDFKNGT